MAVSICIVGIAVLRLVITDLAGGRAGWTGDETALQLASVAVQIEREQRINVPADR